MFNQCRPRDAVEQFVGDEYIQHNPGIADGQAPFTNFFERMAGEYPGKKVLLKLVIAEGNLVVLHCHHFWPGNSDYAGIDFFDSTIMKKS
ncbi:hypothetical protein BA177_09245 [Woeseia oceani]|uniref:SnoaL-like domain-containing protein n=1 Tax=Woeseia oceani TaxID=1548547 RepID=A0A193LG66_9GAMM|nr:hypothetical protein BA177_09245 [Woeseia oceani]